MSDRDLSMFTTVQRHGDTLERHEQGLEEHAAQLRVQAEQIKQLQDNGIRLENTVMAENRETRATITETNRQLHGLINGLMSYKTGESTLRHSYRMAQLESVAKIVGILAGSGGILYYIFG